MVTGITNRPKRRLTDEEIQLARQRVDRLDPTQTRRAAFSKNIAERRAAQRRLGVTGSFEETRVRPTGTAPEAAVDITNLPTTQAREIREKAAATGREITRIGEEREAQQATAAAVEATKTPEQRASEERISQSINSLLGLFTVTEQPGAPQAEEQPRVVGTRQVELTDEFGNVQIVDQPILEGEFGDPSSDLGLLLQGGALALGAGPGLVAARQLTAGLSRALSTSLRTVLGRLGLGGAITTPATAGAGLFGGGLLRTIVAGASINKVASTVSTRASNLETSIVNLREVGSFVQTGVSAGAISKEDGLDFLNTAEQEIDRLYGDLQVLVKVNPLLLAEGKDQEILTRYIKAKSDLAIRRAAIEQTPLVEPDPVEAAFLLNNIQRFNSNLG